jgi:hypothetical protein
MARSSMSKKEGPEESSGTSGWKFVAAVVIVIGVIIGFYAYQNSQQQAKREENRYNGFDFEKSADNLWITRIQVGRQPYDIPFYYHPKDTETVVVERAAVNPVLKRPSDLYISVDPDAGSQVVVAGVEIARITGDRYNILNIPTRSALSKPADVRVDFPVLNCQNSTEDLVVIQFVPGLDNVIVRSEKYPNCVILNYVNASESVRVADRYAYMLLKIM